MRLEAEAVLLIMGRCQSREWQMLGSEAINAEIAQTPDVERRKRLMLLASLAMNNVILNKQVESRAMELVQLEFKAYDSLHIACAEMGNADILLTTDDRLMLDTPWAKAAGILGSSSPLTIINCVSYARDGSVLKLFTPFQKSVRICPTLRFQN